MWSKERMREYQKIWYAAHREESQRRALERYQNHRQHCLQVGKAYRDRSILAARQAKVAPGCLNCGMDNAPALRLTRYGVLCRNCHRKRLAVTHPAPTHPNSIMIRDLKISAGCAHCGTRDPSVLDFHHVDPASKSFNIGDCPKKRGRERILSEIAKCIVICANCHVLEEENLGENFRPAKFTEEILAGNVSGSAISNPATE